ncbi:hypothetical protein ACTHQ1_12660 [Janibacter anophelis]|uniref:Uncharacterized protein n=1 Tax=Janibacter limosus TaxID=53458 RepID=A0A4P6MZ25_9MICO|nr:hypothetical protein [Janibacter limosus]QBF47150.1 hypothetical protein EXU32_13380 [Janibacter limosus]
MTDNLENFEAPDDLDGTAQAAGAPSAPDEDDHDLLTYSIATDRLRDQIVMDGQELTAVIANHGEDSEQATALRERIQQLRDGVERHGQAQRDHVNEREFFGE